MLRSLVVATTSSAMISSPCPKQGKVSIIQSLFKCQIRILFVQTAIAEYRIYNYYRIFTSVYIKRHFTTLLLTRAKTIWVISRLAKYEYFTAAPSICIIAGWAHSRHAPSRHPARM